MKNLFLALICLLSVNSFAQNKPKDHKIVFQFTNANDTLQQKAFVRQLENITEHWPNAKYEVVVYNQGVELVMKNNTKYQARLQTLKAKGVNFVVCENTLKNRKISKEAFPEILVGFVPAGIAEIVEKQEEGWSYIRGGF
jgi:intracellular sulfur oxidation DsrE/DsrF family protein